MTVLKKMTLGQFKAMPTPSLEMAKDVIKKKISQQADQSSLNELANILNDVVLSNTFKDNKVSSKIFNKLPQVIDRGLENISILDTHAFESKSNNNLWGSYHQAVQQYKIAAENGFKTLTLYEQNRDRALHNALSLQSQLNKLNGQAFESFLQALIPIIESTGEDAVNTTVNTLLSTIDKNKVLSSKGSSQQTIQVQIGEKIMSITGPGKVDVQVESPFLNDEILSISAKNYKNLQNIHLFGGSIVSLITQWANFGIDNNIQNYYYRALGILKGQLTLEHARMIFGLQSLTGGKSDEDLANILIVNIRNRKRPIAVLSIRSLIDKIIDDALEDSFYFKYKNFFVGFDSLSDEEYFNLAKKVSIDVSLNKRYLYVSALKNLT